jgi:probable phosphoglycerate mutase
MSQIVLVRHGATEWSEAGKHTGRTDLPLTQAGQRAARGLHELLARHDFAMALVSPLQRARRTADLAGVTAYDIDPDLVEWDYGGVEGRTTAEVSAELGRAWSIWTDGVAASGGEAVTEVAERGRRVLDRVRPCVEAGRDVLLVGHGHALRVLAATWLGLEPRGGALLALSAGSLSALGLEHGRPVIDEWNLRPL